jgi:uncharacterized protein YutE (UPF0331/DUF86 family)
VSPSKIRLKTVVARAELIREMLAAIETLPLGSEAEFAADPRMVAAGESFLRRCLEGLLDLGRHLLAKGFGKVTAEYAAVADELHAVGVISPEVASKLRLMARYRNRLVHFYDEITPLELYEILKGELQDIRDALALLQRWIEVHPEICDAEL